MKKKINKARLFRNVILGLLLIGIVSIWYANRFVKGKGFEGLGDFITTYNENKALSDGVEAEEITLIVSDKDYSFLENKRQEALDRGIQVNKGDNYVSCRIVTGNDTIDGEMRLKGHMTDHLEGDKWSFRVKAEEEVKGMYRFSLQNPATRNYAYEWVYHKLLAHEEVIHLKYDFVRLKLNDKDLGIYAVEEHFGQHILRDNERPGGAILRWNPELYWEHRLDEFDSVYLDESYSGYSSSFPEAYDKGVVKKDEKLVETCVKAAALLEAFRRGEIQTSEAFDMVKMARFHAVIDLVGGYHSLDWSDVKFFYNENTGLIEPVGYESFSVRETDKIAGQRIPENYSMTGYDYHDRLFSDPEFFAVYIQELERICDEAYFDEFIQSIEEELNVKRGVLAQEFAYIKFSFNGYYKNIDLIRHNLELPKAFHAFLMEKTDSTVQLDLAPVSDYPIEILALVVDGKKELKPDTAIVLPAKARNTFAQYFGVSFTHNGKKLKNLTIKARIPGSINTFEVEVSDLPSYRLIEIPDSVEEELESDSLISWLNDSVGVFKQKIVQINSPVLIPENHQVIVNPGQEIQFSDKGKLVVNGSLNFYGTEEHEIKLSGNDLRTEALDIRNGNLIAVNTQFYNIETDFIQASNSSVSLENCAIADTKGRFIQGVKSKISLIDCASGNMNTLGEFDRCEVKIKSLAATHGDTFLKAYGSDIEMHSSQIKGYNLVADLNHLSDFTNWSSSFEGNEIIGKLNHVSTFKAYVGTISSEGQAVFYLDNETDLPGSSSYRLFRTKSPGVKEITAEG